MRRKTLNAIIHMQWKKGEVFQCKMPLLWQCVWYVPALLFTKCCQNLNVLIIIVTVKTHHLFFRDLCKISLFWHFPNLTMSRFFAVFTVPVLVIFQFKNWCIDQVLNLSVYYNTPDAYLLIWNVSNVMWLRSFIYFTRIIYNSIEMFDVCRTMFSLNFIKGGRKCQDKFVRYWYCLLIRMRNHKNDIKQCINKA